MRECLFAVKRLGDSAGGLGHDEAQSGTTVVGEAEFVLVSPRKRWRRRGREAGRDGLRLEDRKVVLRPALVAVVRRDALVEGEECLVDGRHVGGRMERRNRVSARLAGERRNEVEKGREAETVDVAPQVREGGVVGCGRDDGGSGEVESRVVRSARRSGKTRRRLAKRVLASFLCALRSGQASASAWRR